MSGYIIYHTVNNVYVSHILRLYYRERPTFVSGVVFVIRRKKNKGFHDKMVGNQFGLCGLMDKQVGIKMWLCLDFEVSYVKEDWNLFSIDAKSC